MGMSSIAPDLLGYEMANICVTRIRRNPQGRTAIVNAYQGFAMLTIAVVPVEHGKVAGLAERAGLSAYDAAYLWLARHLNAPLVTLDRRLAGAAAGP